MIHTIPAWHLSLKDATDSVCGLSQLIGFSASISLESRFLKEIQLLEQHLRTNLMKSVECTLTEEHFRMLRKVLMMLDAKLAKPGLGMDHIWMLRATFNLLQVNIKKTKLKII